MKRTRTIHERKETEYQREADAMLIFATLRRDQVDTTGGEVVFLDTAIRWTAAAIAEHSGLVPFGSTDDRAAEIARVNRALLYLCARQWVSAHGRRNPVFKVTIYGVESYHQEAKHPHMDTGAAAIAFRDEVLTGCDARGRQSGITWASLPSRARQNRSENNAEEEQLKRCVQVERVHKIAVDNGMVDAAVIDMLATGEIHTCNRCGRMKRHHRDSSSRHSWQSACITCRKTARK